MLQRTFELGGASAFALGQVGLHAQARQRGFELVGGIGQETFLGGDGVFEAVEQVVDRRNQGCYFQRHGFFVQRAQVVRGTGADAVFQALEGLDAARQRQPDQQHRQRQDDELRQHHAFDNFGRQHRAFFTRLGHLHQGQGVAGQVQGDPKVGHAHVEATHFVVAQVDRAFGRFFGGRRRGEVVLAAEELTAPAQHLVVDLVGVVGAHEFAGRQGQVELRLVRLRHHQQLRQGLHVVFQRPVERLARNALRHQPGQRQADGPQQQQGREHPVQDFTEQGTLLALEDFHGVRKGWITSAS